MPSDTTTACPLIPPPPALAPPPLPLQVARWWAAVLLATLGSGAVSATVDIRAQFRNICAHNVTVATWLRPTPGAGFVLDHHNCPLDSTLRCVVGWFVVRPGQLIDIASVQQDKPFFYTAFVNGTTCTSGRGAGQYLVSSRKECELGQPGCYGWRVVSGAGDGDPHPAGPADW